VWSESPGGGGFDASGWSRSSKRDPGRRRHFRGGVGGQRRKSAEQQRGGTEGMVVLVSEDARLFADKSPGGVLMTGPADRGEE